MRVMESWRGSGNGPVDVEGHVTFSPGQHRPNAARLGMSSGSWDTWMPWSLAGLAAVRAGATTGVGPGS
jgi:hypothetical protein